MLYPVSSVFLILRLERQWGARSANLKLVPCEGSRQTVQGQTVLPTTKTPYGRSRAIGPMLLETSLKTSQKSEIAVGRAFSFLDHSDIIFCMKFNKAKNPKKSLDRQDKYFLERKYSDKAFQKRFVREIFFGLQFTTIYLAFYTLKANY